MLIFSGIAILVVLATVQYWQSRETSRLIASIEQIPFDTLIAEDENNEHAEAISPVPEGSAIGILKIDKIALKVPIVEGAGAEQLRSAVGHMPESGSVGGIGQNFAIAGHRSSVLGKFFNRLDELTEGDEFTIQNKQGTFTFRIFDKRIVDPTDLDAIAAIEGKSVSTLITCHPFRSNKQRLLIFGELIEEADPLPANQQYG